mgnify:CR=1 FL=1
MAQTSVLTMRETRLVDGTTELGEVRHVDVELGTCLPTRPASYGPMSGPSNSGGLVSNDSDNMTRNPAVYVQTRSAAGLVCNSLCCYEPQLVKPNRENDLSLGLSANSRMFNEPSAPRQIPFYLDSKQITIVMMRVNSNSTNDLVITKVRMGLNSKQNPLFLLLRNSYD